jgi:hypothetical protein
MEIMKKPISMISCPSCSGPLRPQVLVCDDCDIKVEGHFAFNEFATLAPEDLHFLRVFLQCEGRIRDMEGALGLSYPTVRARLSELKGKVMGHLELSEDSPNTKTADAAGANRKKTSSAGKDSTVVSEALSALERKEISFDEALKKIQQSRKT